MSLEICGGTRMNQEEQIKLLNEIIMTAIIHGGDYGGPYFSYKQGFTEAINNWLKFNNITDYTLKEIGYENDQFICPGMPQLVPIRSDNEQLK